MTNQPNLFEDCAVTIERDRKVVGSGNRFYRWIETSGYPDGYRVLCHNCNIALGLYGFCPHETPTPTSLMSDEELTARGHPGLEAGTTP